MDSKINENRIKNSIDFLDDFWMVFGRVFETTLRGDGKRRLQRAGRCGTGRRQLVTFVFSCFHRVNSCVCLFWRKKNIFIWGGGPGGGSIARTSGEGLADDGQRRLQRAGRCGTGRRHLVTFVFFVFFSCEFLCVSFLVRKKSFLWGGSGGGSIARTSGEGLADDGKRRLQRAGRCGTGRRHLVTFAFNMSLSCKFLCVLFLGQKKNIFSMGGCGGGASRGRPARGWRMTGSAAYSALDVAEQAGGTW